MNTLAPRSLGPLAVLALLATGPAAAGNQDESWIKLDQEINSLSASLGAQGKGVDVGALIRSSYVDVDDDLLEVHVDTNDEDVSAFVFQDVDVWLEGTVGEYDWRVSIDFDGGSTDGDDFFGNFFELQDGLDNPGNKGREQIATEFFSDSPSAFGHLTGQSFNTGGGADLEDAYGTWNGSETFRVTFGQFKSPVLLSQMVDEENQLFINRTILGGAFDNWQLGAMLHGDYENFGWFLAMQNGADGLADDYRYTARVEYYIGDGASGRGRRGGRDGFEGSYGASDDTHATVGASYREDDGLGDDAKILALDGAATMGPWSVAAELLDLDDDVGDGNVFAVTGGFMVVPDELEAAIRYEDLDEFFDTTKITVGLNYYQSGHNAKWSLNLSDIELDDVDIDGTLIELGLTLGSTRS